MAATENGPVTTPAVGEVEGLSTVLDSGLFGEVSTERFDRLRKGLSASGENVELDTLADLGRRLHDRKVSLKDAVKIYKEKSDTRRWPIVVVRPNADQTKLEDRILTLGFEIVPSLASAYRKVGLIPLRVPPEFPFVEALSRRPDISRIERSWARTGVPDSLPDSKGLLTYPDELLDADTLDSDFFSRRDPIRIGLIDSGIDARHQVLQTHLIDQRSFRLGEDRVGDRFGHGTAVAGTITKLCPSALFFSAKVFTESGSGNLDDLIRAVAWMKRKAPDIVICSAVIGGEDKDTSILTRLFEDLAKAGIPTIVPAYNSDGDLAAPANARGVISVAMSSARISSKATILARGDQLRVPRSIQADKMRFPLLQSPAGFTSFESPAAAAAIVTATAALLIRCARNIRHKASASELREALLAGCEPGKRLLDPQKAIEAYTKTLEARSEAAAKEVLATAPKEDLPAPPLRTKTPTGPALPALGQSDDFTATEDEEEAATYLSIPSIPNMPAHRIDEPPTITFPAHELATGAIQKLDKTSEGGDD
jgi:hypothetical protein